jgi:catechol 2,3-dioxygenase-like lactoylglutathione lyase family enzyme
MVPLLSEAGTSTPTAAPGASEARRPYCGVMLTGMHVLVYAEDPEAARAFFRDVLEWPNVDAHDGWLIFGTGPSELGVHPLEGGPLQHQISLMCDDIDGTVAELSSRGAHFSGDIEAASFGRTITMRVPGGGEMLVYEPRHPTAIDL